MGTWGAGLYASDLALDLRAAIAAVVKLPFDEQRLVDVLRDVYPDTAQNSDDEEHTVFWLVVADQFEKRGIASLDVRRRALDIIDRRSDLDVQAGLGLSGAALRKREQLLADLKVRLLAGPTTSKPRKVMSGPQPFLLEEGGLYLYPTQRGRPVNPYFNQQELDRSEWRPDGYGAMLIAKRGRAFGFLAWYQPIVAARAFPSRPSAEQLAASALWLVHNPGTLSQAHHKKMQIEHVGTVPLDGAKVEALLGARRFDIQCAVADISISNAMAVADGSVALDKVANQYLSRPKIERLGEIQI